MTTTIYFEEKRLIDGVTEAIIFDKTAKAEPIPLEDIVDLSNNNYKPVPSYQSLFDNLDVLSLACLEELGREEEKTKFVHQSDSVELAEEELSRLKRKLFPLPKGKGFTPQVAFHRLCLEELSTKFMFFDDEKHRKEEDTVYIQWHPWVYTYNQCCEELLKDVRLQAKEKIRFFITAVMRPYAKPKYGYKITSTGEKKIYDFKTPRFMHLYICAKFK
jgi:hypothetical protein